MVGVAHGLAGVVAVVDRLGAFEASA